MRISAVPGDSGHDLWSLYTPKQRSQIKILVDGVEVRDVQTADDGLGRVDVYVRDENNRFIAEGDHVLVNSRYGKVEIQLPEAP